MRAISSQLAGRDYPGRADDWRQRLPAGSAIGGSGSDSSSLSRVSRLFLAEAEWGVFRDACERAWPVILPPRSATMVPQEDVMAHRRSFRCTRGGQRIVRRRFEDEALRRMEARIRGHPARHTRRQAVEHPVGSVKSLILGNGHFVRQRGCKAQVAKWSWRCWLRTPDRYSTRAERCFRTRIALVKFI